MEEVMPAKSRSEIIDPTKVGIYHCYNQIVQRRHLFGMDHFTGRDYGYRKPIVRDEFRRLAANMAVDVLDYAILDSHLHTVLRNRPDIVESWDNDEVVWRWWQVSPKRKNKDGTPCDPRPNELKMMLFDIDEYRVRLSSISWMMRLACQRVGRMCNAEDGHTGRFFARRFESDPLETFADILQCSLYVDLNIIRAGLAKTPEQSEYCSVYDRIRARSEQIRQEMDPEGAIASSRLADDWLAPIFLDERADAYVGPFTASQEAEPAKVQVEAESFDMDAMERAGQEEDEAVNHDESSEEPLAFENINECELSATGCQPMVATATRSSRPDTRSIRRPPVTAPELAPFYNPVGAARVSNKGFLPFDLDQYLTLVDVAGRIIREDKRGAIPDDLPPILERLGVPAETWFEELWEWVDFGSKRRRRGPAMAPV